MGVHSTLFGPVKYAILPQHLKPDELIGGNGLVEMGTFVAILLGTIIGGLVVAIPGNGPVLAGAVAVAVAVAGWLVSRGIPDTPAVAPDLAINWNPFTETAKNLRFAYGNRVVWLSMLGISWFWFYGATFLTQFPNFAKDVLGGDEHVVTLLLALFSIGIGVGLAAVRTPVGPQGRDRPGAVRLDRPHGVRDRPLVRVAVDARRRTPGRRRVPRAARALAGRRGPDADRAVRRLLHRAALRADPAALRGVAPVADHRGEQHPERGLHGRVGGPRDRAAVGRACRSRTSSSSPPSSTRRSRSSSTSWCPSS